MEDAVTDADSQSEILTTGGDLLIERMINRMDSAETRKEKAKVRPAALEYVASARLVPQNSSATLFSTAAETKPNWDSETESI